MAKLQGSKTEKNLLKAFAGESQARNRYTYFAGQARKEGYIQMAMIFEETANHEKEHAKRFFKYLEGGMVEITACYPAGVIGTTLENLKEAAAGEYEEHSDLYPGFAAIAEEEGFKDVANCFKMIAKAEMYHEKRYNALIKNIEDLTVFKKEKSITWKCLNCGYNHEGTEPPAKCPACQHPSDYFEISCENWY